MGMGIVRYVILSVFADSVKTSMNFILFRISNNAMGLTSFPYLSLSLYFRTKNVVFDIAEIY